MDSALFDLTRDGRERILTQSMAHFRNPSGSDLLRRTERFQEFVNGRAQHGLWPFSRVLETGAGRQTEVSDINGIRRVGLNFASHDYLGLNCDPRVGEAACRAIRDFGPHSGGSAILIGNSRLSLALETAVAEMLQMEQVTLYPTGWAAGYGSIAALVRPRDYVVMDYLSHACLQEGARAATQQVAFFAHNDPNDLREKLSAIRANDPRNGILVVTEGLFSMDSDSPDLGALQAVCREYEAIMLVDVAHDLGSVGPGGGGALAQQGMLGKVDLVTGSFSKTFVSSGGFLATHLSAVRLFAKYFGNPHMFSNFLAPMQAAIVLEAMRIARSMEGDALRDRLLANAGLLRNEFAAQGVTCQGVPSGIVPVPFHNDRLARLAARRIAERCVFVNLVEYPAVSAGGARIRMLVMATHGPSDVREAAAKIVQALEQAKEDLALWQADELNVTLPHSDCIARDSKGIVKTIWRKLFGKKLP